MEEIIKKQKHKNERKFQSFLKYIIESSSFRTPAKSHPSMRAQKYRNGNISADLRALNEWDLLQYISPEVCLSVYVFVFVCALMKLNRWLL